MSGETQQQETIKFKEYELTKDSGGWWVVRVAGGPPQGGDTLTYALCDEISRLRTLLGLSLLPPPTTGFIVEIWPGCWLAQMYGDPGRTTDKKRAKVYPSQASAFSAISQASIHKDMSKARIEAVEAK